MQRPPGPRPARPRTLRGLAVRALPPNNVMVLLLLLSTYFVLANKARLAASRAARAAELPGDEGPEEVDDSVAFASARPAAKARKKGHAWHMAKERVGKNYTAAPLPSIEDLPFFIGQGHHGISWNNVFIHKGNYAKMMDGFKDGNATMRKNGRPNEHFKNNFLLPMRSFPDDLSILSEFQFSSCAVVGSSGSLLNTTFGAAIDSHATVVRINQAPTNKKYWKRVGKKTTIRLINTRWTNKYGDPRFIDGVSAVRRRRRARRLTDAGPKDVEAPGSKGQGLPLEQGVALISTRATPRAYDKMVQYLKMVRPDVKTLFLTSRVVSQARRLLVTYRTRLEETYGAYYGGSTPSSGFISTYMMMQLCDKITLYGFGLDDEGGHLQKYHYFKLFSDGERKNMMNPTHSFDTERCAPRPPAPPPVPGGRLTNTRHGVIAILSQTGT